MSSKTISVKGSKVIIDFDKRTVEVDGKIPSGSEEVEQHIDWNFLVLKAFQEEFDNLKQCKQAVDEALDNDEIPFDEALDNDEKPFIAEIAGMLLSVDVYADTEPHVITDAFLTTSFAHFVASYPLIWRIEPKNVTPFGIEIRDLLEEEVSDAMDAFARDIHSGHPIYRNHCESLIEQFPLEIKKAMQSYFAALVSIIELYNDEITVVGTLANVDDRVGYFTSAYVFNSARDALDYNLGEMNICVEI